MHEFEVQIWENSEHWYFFTTYKADTKEEAYKMAKKDFGRGFRIMSVR